MRGSTLSHERRWQTGSEQAGDGQARSRRELIDFPDPNPYSVIEVTLPDRAAMPQTFDVKGPMRHGTDRLCDLLEEACRDLESMDDGPIFSIKYGSCSDLSQFVRTQIAAIKAGSISTDAKCELWTIFAPTCTWDDAGGDSRIGNETYSELDKLYGREVLEWIKSNKAQHPTA